MKSKLFIFFILSFSFLRAQEDSLRKALSSHIANSAKVQLLLRLAEAVHNRHAHREAIKILEEGVRLADSLHYYNGVGNCNNQLSVIWKELGDYTLALEHSMTARKLGRTTGNLRLEVSAAINCANIYFLKGDPEETMRIQKEALRLAMSDTSAILRRSVATCQGNLATCFHIQGVFDSAKVYYQKALAYYLKNGPNKELAAQYTNIGALYWDQKQYKEALLYLEKAADLLRRENDKMNLVAAILNIGEIYLDLNQPDKAMPLIEEAMRSAYESQSRDRIMQAHYIMAEAFRKMGKFSEAVTHFERYSGLKDSLLNESNNRNIAEMQTRFETEKKEQEIQLLQKDKNIRDLQISEQEANINRQRIVIYSIIAGLAAVIALVFFILKNYREKKRINLGLERKNVEINLQKKHIEEKNTLITDSIEYARTIQHAILPGELLRQQLLKEHFILYLPKDVVSGDFYWMHSLSSSEYLYATIDCTGHGVPGAFMSVMAFNMLENIVSDKKITQPAAILDELNNQVVKTLRQEMADASAKFGMDISLMHVDTKKSEIQFAGAHNPMIVMTSSPEPSASSPSVATIGAKAIKEFKADKTTIGMARGKFTNHTFTYRPGDTIYLFTDGYADQKGQTGKKLFAQDLRDLIADASHLSLQEQNEFFRKTFFERKGTHEQVDDVLLAGIRL